MLAATIISSVLGIAFSLVLLLGVRASPEELETSKNFIAGLIIFIVIASDIIVCRGGF